MKVPLEEGRVSNSATENTSGSLGASFVGSRGFFGGNASMFDTNYGIPSEEGVALDMKQRRLDLKGAIREPFSAFRGVRLRFGVSHYEHRELEGDEVGLLIGLLGLDTYVRGQNKTDVLPLAQLPPLEARVGIQYSTGRWLEGALARAAAAQDRYSLNQGNTMGQDLGPTAGFSVFSLNGSWRIAPRVDLRMGADNLFNKAYAEFISRGGAGVPGFTPTTRVNEPGRMLWLKLGLRY